MMLACIGVWAWAQGQTAHWKQGLFERVRRGSENRQNVPSFGFYPERIKFADLSEHLGD